jgi:uncharacterized protein
LPPAPAARVNDYARLLTPAERDRLEARLAERERATGVQMAIAIFPSLEGESLEDVSIRLAQTWRVGQKGLDTGVILVVFVRERRLRVEMGYGLEAVLPDAAAGQIIRERIAPRFREQRWAAGLEAAVDAVFERIETRRTPARRGVAGGPSPWMLGFVGLVGLVMMMLLWETLSIGRRARRNVYSAGRRGWDSPPIVGPWWGGGGSSGSSGGGIDTFSPGGGSFGGGGASGEW